MKKGLWNCASLVALGVATGGICTGGPAWAQAQSAVAMQIPAGPLGESLIAVARLSGEAISIDPTLVAGRSAPAVSGNYTDDQAFAALLAGSGLRVARGEGGALVLVAVPQVDVSGAEGRVLGTVDVSGAADSGATGGDGFVGAGGTIALPTQSANGSSDVLATEGTRSYAPIGTSLVGGSPAAIHDTPRTVSVVTRQIIEDQRLDTLNDALGAVPGIYTSPSSTTSSNIVSRGFAIQNFQVDGSAPFISNGNNGSGYQPLFDLSEFDNISVVRGGDALASGFGDPGGTVNLQRKRPLDHFQILATGTIGSYDKYRGSIDVSVPLALDGRLAARVVGTHDQTKFFYDRAFRNADTVLATVEFAPNTRTSINIGGTYRHEKAAPAGFGLPLYVDLGKVGFPRSTCFCFDDDISKRDNWEVFGHFKHEFSSMWRVNANVQYARLDSFSSTTSLLPVVGVSRTGPSAIFLYGFSADIKSRQITADANVDGGFMMFGRAQTFSLGVSHNSDKLLDYQQVTYDYPDYPYSIYGPYYDIVNFNPKGNLNRTESPTGQFLYGQTDQTNVYGQIRLNPLARLWLTVSGRYQEYFYKTATDYSGFVLGESSHVSGFQRPGYSVRYDITKRLNIYGSLTYMDAQSTSSAYVDKAGAILAPPKGDNVEAGFKYATPNGRLNLSLAGFRTRRVGNLAFDFAGAASVPNGYPGTNCCFLRAADTQVSGAEFELNGALGRYWQVQGGYTYTFQQKFDSLDSTGATTARPQFLVPDHLLKFATAYDMAGVGLSGLTLGGNVIGQTKVAGQSFVYDGIAFFNGGYPYGTNGRLAYVETKGYVVADVFVRYALKPGVTVQVNVSNLLDKTYYVTNGGVTGGNRYGEPRAAQITLAAKF